MKKVFILILAFVLCYGCKAYKNTNSETKKEEEAYNSAKAEGMENKKEAWWTSFDDELDVKAQAKVDTALFRRYMEKKLPPEKIFDLFGSGYHNFYLALTIIKENESTIMLCTDASFWVGAGRRTQDLVLKEGKSLPKHIPKFRNRPVNYEADKQEIFNIPDFDINKIFNVKPGKLDGKTVKSVKLFEINLIINNKKEIVRPWRIHEVDISKYRVQLSEKNVNIFYYSTGLPAVSIDGFESIRKAITYPEEALKNGVTGRVIVQLFADVNGNFAGYKLLKGLGYGCDEAVINAVKNAKFRAYPIGQRSSIIVPFEFGPPQSTPIDLAVQYFNYNPDPNVYNNINLDIVNKNKLDKNIDKDYFIYVYVNKHLIFRTICRSISKAEVQHQFWIRFDERKPGTYEYVVYIDPENRLNDSNRENNTLRGTLIVK